VSCPTWSLELAGGTSRPGRPASQIDLPRSRGITYSSCTWRSELPRGWVVASKNSTS
jgi:hypothetical protein